MKVKLSFLILVPLFLIILVSQVLAEKPDNPGDKGRLNREEHRVEKIHSMGKRSSTSTARLRACESKQANVTKRMDQLTRLATNMQEKFDAIAGRVQQFYTDKVVPQNITVANYDSLVSDIQTKKDAVKLALDQAKSVANGFTCDTEDPKAQLTEYRKAMQDVKKALKEYRTSIKNLIVAIHTAVGDDDKPFETPTPTPTETPTPTPTVTPTDTPTPTPV